MDDDVSMSSTVEPNIGVILDIKPAVLIDSDRLVGMDIRFRPDSRRGLPAIVVLPFPPLESNALGCAEHRRTAPCNACLIRRSLYLGCDRMSELFRPQSSNGIPTVRRKAILTIDAVTGCSNEML
jgi:hypothetical protein